MSIRQAKRGAVVVCVLTSCATPRSDAQRDTDPWPDTDVADTDRRRHSDRPDVADETDPGVATESDLRVDTDVLPNSDDPIDTDLRVDTDLPTETDTDRPAGPPALESCPPGTRRTGLTWADATWVASSDRYGNDRLYLRDDFAIGDVDGNASDDLVFAGLHYPNFASSSGYDDVVFLRRGPLTPVHEVPDPAVSAVRRLNYQNGLGSSLAVADLDGDGRDEIGAGNYEAVHVLTFDDFATGFTDRGLQSGTLNTRFGDAVCAWPDPAAPGVGHFLGGAYRTTTAGGFSAGAMWRVDGIPAGWDTIDATTAGWESTTRQGYAGTSLASVGDRDGDGIDDVLVGGLNTAWLVSGAQLLPGGGGGVLATFVLDPYVRPPLGLAIVDAAGDVDDDGLRDLLIGFPAQQDHRPCDSATPELDTACDAPQAGKPYALLWRLTGSPLGVVTLVRADAIVSYTALRSGRMGRTADAGDLDGDGDREVLVPLAQRRGDAVLLFDDDAPTAPERLFEGWASHVGVADLTGDRRPDLVLVDEYDLGVFELCPAP